MKKRSLAIAALAILLAMGIVTARSNRPKPQTSSAPKLSYIALGDSVAAGVGLEGDSDSSACDRTDQSYPNQVASKLNYQLHNLACSGATLTNGILGSQNVNNLQTKPQLQQLLALPKPTLITLTIGANDVDWTTILAKCYTSVCGTDSDTAAIQSKLAVVGTNLQSTLSQIQSAYKSGAPHVLVTGYHQVFPTTVSAGCTDLNGIDPAELAWGRQLQSSINDTLQQAVSGYAFARFVPVNFTGHELCSPDPWVQGLADKQPYHPTQTGQATFARAIVTAVEAKH